MNRLGITATIALLPSLVLAQSFRTVVGSLVGFINQLVVLLTAASLLVFFYGLAMFIYKAGDTGSHEKGRNLMLWGVIIFFVMSSIWGIINFVGASFFS